jgi:ubiquinone/menaquinone biosynthesis C-methylase UbiE
MKKKQKEIFLKNEGNAWFERNHNKVKSGLKDPIIKAISKCLGTNSSKKKTLLEIGCGEAKRLHWISKNFNFQCYGVEPSEKAVAFANSKNVTVIKGTADLLDFKKKFDFVVFGFCLYLCDRSDLFQIVKEADRVLKNNGYLIILDFYSTEYIKNKYNHYSGIFSYKMDYRKMFDWHPSYNCFYHEVSTHLKNDSIDYKDNLVATSIFRKKIYK